MKSLTHITFLPGLWIALILSLPTILYSQTNHSESELRTNLPCLKPEIEEFKKLWGEYEDYMLHDLGNELDTLASLVNYFTDKERIEQNFETIPQESYPQKKRNKLLKSTQNINSIVQFINSCVGDSFPNYRNQVETILNFSNEKNCGETTMNLYIQDLNQINKEFKENFKELKSSITRGMYRNIKDYSNSYHKEVEVFEPILKIVLKGIDQKDSTFSALQKKYESLKNQNEKLAEDNEKLGADREKLFTEIAALESQKLGLESVISQNQSSLKTLKDTVRREDSIINSLRGENNKLGENLLERKDELTLLSKQFTDSIESLENLKEDIEILKEKAASIRESNKNLVEENKILESDILERKNYLSILIALLAIVILGFLFYNRRLYKAKTEKENESRRLKEANGKILRGSRKLEEYSKELSHRVKNNIQDINSHISLHMRRLKRDGESYEPLVKIKRYLEVYSLIHNHLYSKDQKALSWINLKQYVNELLTYYQELGQEKEVTVYADLEEIHIDIDYATDIGVLINELISNFYKHVVPKVPKPEFQLKIHADTSGVHIKMNDNGPGFDTQNLTRGRSSFGLNYIQGLIQDRGGEIEISNSNGTCYEIFIPVKKNRFQIEEQPIIN